MPTDIEWCRTEDGTKGQTWNPVRGCTKISPGCKPLRRKKPTTYFVNSMSDLFHEQVPFEYIAAVFGVMAACPQHTFLVLTKRADRMRKFSCWVEHEQRHRGDFQQHAWQIFEAEAVEHVPDLPALGMASSWPLQNVWLGVSVEDRKYGLPRIDELRATPAAVRFLSVEPLLEDLGTLDLTGIDWVIVGGESGHGARPMHPDWARSIRDQCVAAGVPFLFKQWGAWVPRDHTEHPPKGSNWGVLERDGNYLETATTWTDEPNGGVAIRLVGKDKAGRVLDGRTWDEMPRRSA